MKEFLKIWLPIIILIIGAFWFTAQFLKPIPNKEITIATGRSGGTYYNLAQKYKTLLEKEDITVNIVETAGSIDSLSLLKAHEVDISFVQGGTVDHNLSQSLESIASIYFEPLWLFTPKEKEKISYLKELQSKRISIGEQGSGTGALIEQIVKANKLKVKDTKLEYLGLLDSAKALKAGEIDAFFSVVSTHAPVILNLLSDEHIEAISLKRIKAYEQNFSYLKGITIYEGSIDLVNNLPKEDIHLLATTANLLVHKDLDDTLVRLFTKVVKKENNRDDGFPSTEYLELPLNPQAKQYLLHGDTILEKFFPYWIAANMDRLKIMLIPLLTLLIPLFKGFMPLYRWRIRSKIYKWYKQLDLHDRRWEQYDKQTLHSGITEIEHLQQEIKADVDVPLAYMNEYYMLKTHVDFVLKKMRTKAQNL
ncbi:MAG: TAXI family TRAP transporter solute-binding subunit [Epsilonproteobacteria bacterium]|nr:TAXI family TRAP transporter solute-binding subunit [Campylobacterota bacterium]